VALVQARSDVGTETYDPREANLTRALAAIEDLRARNVELAAFGELFLSGYRTDDLLTRYATVVDPPDAHVGALTAACAAGDLHVLIGAATLGGRVPGDIYNSALLIGPEGVVGVYRKTHVAAFPYAHGVSMERAFYSPGRDLPVFDLPSGCIGAHICYDMAFPEVARVQTLLGAEVLVNLAAAAADYERNWEHMPYVRAVENAVWYLVCSVVGEQRKDVMVGGSRIVDPTGVVVAQAKKGDEDLVVADIDLSLARSTRAALHLLSNRQPGLYTPITDAIPYP
jgi:predicted amidohydrolase